MKILTYLTLFLIIFSCSDSFEDDSSLQNGEFSREEAQDLAKILDSSVNTNDEKIIEKHIIGDTSRSKQIKNDSVYIHSIWQLINSRDLNCNNPKTDIYRNMKLLYCAQSADLDLFIVQYERDNIAFTEKYLTRKNKLIYAIEWEKRTADMEDNDATYWNCEYIINNKNVVDHISLGMGKTESESFNLQEIVKIWETRKAQLMKLKN